MRNLLQRPSANAEFALVVAGAFGLLVGQSLVAVLSPPKAVAFSQAELWWTIAYEAAALCLLGSFLYVRGWKGDRLGLASHWSDAPIGFGLALGVYWIARMVLELLAATSPSLAQAASGTQALPHNLSVWVVAAAVLVSPFFEEFFVTGYVISALKEKWGETWAVNVSVALRLLYNIDQGVGGVITIIPLGLIFAYWFSRTKRLWPLVAAHAVFVLVSLLYAMKS